MILSNLNTNHKIMLGVSAITLLAIIYKYVQNMFRPKQKMIEGQTSFAERYGTPEPIVPNQNSGLLGMSASAILATTEQAMKNNILLQGIYDELGEFNHIYQERMFEQILPSQIKKTIIHLSSIDHINAQINIGEYSFYLPSSGQNTFNNVINMKILGAQMPYVPQNIYAENSPTHTTPSNVLYFISGSNVTVTPGYYTIHSLISTLNNGMNASGIDGHFSFDNITKLVSLNGNASGISASGVLHKKLGFGTNNVTNRSNLNNLASYIADLSIHYIDISYTNIHPLGATWTNNNNNILKRIPLNGQPGDIIYYNAPHSDYLSQELFKPDHNSEISTIIIKLQRHDNTIYNLMGLNFDLKLEITVLIEPTLLNAIDAHMRRDQNRFFKNDGGKGSVLNIGGEGVQGMNINIGDSFLPG